MNKNLVKGIILIVLLGLPPLFSLFGRGLPLTHDGVDHVARIANFYQALSEGILFPRWAPNLNWGYGHPILMFLYPFSSYAASLFHFLGFSYIDSLKIIFGIGFLASGVTMYLWMKEQCNTYVGIVAAVLYMYAPYRFVDLYVRGAIGEHMAFIFPPLILYFILKFFKSEKAWTKYLNFFALSVSFALLLLAHNAISLMFVPVFLAYIIYQSWVNKNIESVMFVSLAFLTGLILSGFFTFPAFFEGKFTLRDIVTGDEYSRRFVQNPLSFLYGEWNFGITGQFSVQLGIMHILGVLLVPFFLIKKKIDRKIKVLSLIFVGFFVFSLFIQLSISNVVYELVTTFKKFQFPWRFLSLSLFSTSVSASLTLLLVSKKRKTVVAVVVLLIILSTAGFWGAKGYLQKNDTFFESIYHGTTDTGESAPIWSVRFMEKEPDGHMNVVGGKAIVQEKGRTSIKRAYEVNVTTAEARLRENTLYFPGWKVFVDGKQATIQFQDSNERGLITFLAPSGKHSVLIEFGDTKLRLLSNILSIVTLGLLLVFGFIVKVYGKKRQQKK